ncbi:MAG: M48 family metalloprotease, partial [Proteobacteria bacterium]|nr:M48 family metalloprotease [Pseudomonadota bacterium]
AGLITAVGGAALETANVQGADLLLQGGALATNLVLMKYSRDQERQADELGMGYMVQVGYNPDGMAQTMEILLAAHERQPSELEALFQSHPLSSERLETARQMAAAYPSLRTRERLREEPFREATARLREVSPAYAKMDEGRKALAGNQSAEAVRLLTEATRLAPDQALIWVHRAAAEAKAEKLPEGYASAQRAVSLYPDLYHARLVAGALALDLGKFSESLAHLEMAEKVVPGQPQVAFFQGRALEGLGRREEAARKYAAVLENVQKGPMAEYSYQRLVEWGYIRPQPARQQ